jgi:hypothetical protein
VVRICDRGGGPNRLLRRRHGLRRPFRPHS